MVSTVYIDTSVIGRLFDEKFQLWTELIFKDVNGGIYKTVEIRTPREILHHGD